MTNLPPDAARAPGEPHASGSVLASLQALGSALGQPRWAQGPGGNVSVKDDGALWVKASGKRLVDVAYPGGHACVDLEDAAKALAGDAAADARVFAVTPRPSLETYFHALGPRVVAHTHAVAVLLAACATAVPPELALTVVPYERPGRGLALAVGRARAGMEESAAQTVLLASHGLLVYASTTDEAIAASRDYDARCRAHYGVSPTSFDELLASYTTEPPVDAPGGFAQRLPARAHADRYLFPDAVVYASIARVGRAELGHLPASVAALGRPAVVVDDANRRIAFAETRDKLEACVEVLVAHDWVEDVLTKRGEARYLGDDEPAKILDLPSEKYRMRHS